MITTSIVISSLFLLMFSLNAVHAQDADAEVTILKYEILHLDEMKYMDNAHYAFEVCICNRPSRDPKLSRSCTCNDLKGRKVRDAPVDNSDLCMENPHADSCLNAALPYFDREPPIYYIRVSANGIVLSRPAWQELTQSDEKTTTASLGSKMRSKISLTFKIKEHLQSWNNRNEKAEKKELPWLLSSSTKSPWRTEYIPTTTTTVAPRREEINENRIDYDDTDYTKWTGINNMYELRQYLFIESLKDRVAPYQLDIQSYKEQIIAYHNALRGMHGAAPLEYDPYLEGVAQRWADTLGDRSSCVAHDPNRRHGECLFYFGGLVLPKAQTLAALTVQSFYLEHNSYDYNNYRPVYFYRTGHFTQLVWKASRRIGVGVVIRLSSGGGAPCRPFSPSYQLYVVVKYDPPGNVQSSYAYKSNVSPRIF